MAARSTCPACDRRYHHCLPLRTFGTCLECHDGTPADPSTYITPSGRPSLACLTRQILVLADRAYQGAGATFRTPYKNHREQPEHYLQFNRDHARLRAPGERAFAQLKSWRILRRARCSTRRIDTIVQAIHTLLT